MLQGQILLETVAWINNGKMMQTGPAADVVATYQSSID